MISLQLQKHDDLTMIRVLLVAGIGIFGINQTICLPDLVLVQWLGLALMSDFVTAFYRAYRRDETRSSKKMGGTMDKVFMYFGSLAALIIVENAYIRVKSDETTKVLTVFFNNTFVMLMIYREVVSILENIILANKKDLFTLFVLTPIYRVLTLQLKGNILTKINNKGEDNKQV